VRAAGLSGALLTFLFLLVALSPGRTQASDNGLHDLIKLGPVESTETLPGTASPTALRSPVPPRWESVALHDLADELGWPPIVSEDSARLSISLTVSVSEQAHISIRPFDFGAGAAAAFAAEQQDARLAGLQVTTGHFSSFPSYSAVLSVNGVNWERRLHWVSDRWIFGVDVEGTGFVMQSLDTTDLAGRLLDAATQHGLPAPAGATATPEPTHGPPPSSTPTVVNCGVTFRDVAPDYWAYSYISQLACRGVIGGYSDGTFRPQNSTTRAQLTKMIVLVQGWSLANPTRPTFRDVDGSHLFFRYVETAYAHGVVTGYEGNLFKPDLYITRAQVAKMLVRARGWSLEENGPSATLCDVPASHWAWSYIQTAIQHNVFTGYANGCFYPDAYATRAQIAKVVIQGGR
jgi:hypothetical protein